MKVEEKEVVYILNAKSLEYFKHFIKQFQKNYKSGKFQEAHHDAIAVVLQLAKLMNIEIENDH